MTMALPTSPGKGRGRPFKRFHWLIEPYLYLSPAIILIALVMLVPLVVGISYAFQSISLLNPFETGWVGFANFEKLWADRLFWKALTNTFWWTLGSLFFQFFSASVWRYCSIVLLQVVAWCRHWCSCHGPCRPSCQA